MLIDTVGWAILVVCFTVVEGISVGLISIWFSIGGLAALLVSLATNNLMIQFGVFLLVSSLCLMALRPLAKRYFSKNSQPTNFDRVVGEKGVVTEDINNLEFQGRIQVLGQEWSARSVTDTPIPKDTTVVVRRIEGVKLYVEPDTE